VISASALKRNCGYPRYLKAHEPPPRTAKEQEAFERRKLAADRGTMFHAAIELWALGGKLPEVHDQEVQGWLDLLATSWAPTPGTLFEVCAGLTAHGVACWAVETAPGSHQYRRADGGESIATGGRFDVVSAAMEGAHHIVTVRDWKTGKWAVDEAPRNLQVTAGALAFSELVEADGFRREIYYARDGYCDADHDPVLLGTAEADQLLAEVLEAAALDDTPRPGPHCEGCWEKRMRRCAHAA
jgi:hypothetical protein